MVRQAVRWLPLVLVTLAGCASRSTPQAASAHPPKPSELATEEQRQMACLDLRDHIVALYADEYVEQQGLELTTDERAAFRTGWAVEIAKRGTFESFERSCFFSLTPRKYHCGMASQSADGLVACMKLSSR
ncbi:MAG TPA: hypothetical protein VHS09_15370 [Polyangiaceae bacterium]|nr:hypothetical protein [Polyangiaceae bacterium]